MSSRAVEVTGSGSTVNVMSRKEPEQPALLSGVTRYTILPLAPLTFVKISPERAVGDRPVPVVAKPRTFASRLNTETVQLAADTLVPSVASVRPVAEPLHRMSSRAVEATGSGWTVTVMSKASPVQPPPSGVTRYTISPLTPLTFVKTSPNIAVEVRGPPMVAAPVTFASRLNSETVQLVATTLVPSVASVTPVDEPLHISRVDSTGAVTGSGSIVNVMS